MTPAEKRFQNWYDTACPALEPATHAQRVILYIAVPFGFPFTLACADRIHIPVGGKAPSVRYLHGSFPVFYTGAPGCCACVVLVLASAGPSPWLGSRGAGLAVFRAVPCFAAPVVCASASQGGCRKSGWFCLVACWLLAWRGGSLGSLSSSPPQAFCDPVPWCSTFSEATYIGAGVPQTPALALRWEGMWVDGSGRPTHVAPW